MGEPEAVQGTVFDIQDFATDDGPGVRTVVFLKGCPLRCAWCANPEGQRRGLELMHNGDRCRGCLACRGACPGAAVSGDDEGRPTFERERCLSCDSAPCVGACPERALRLSGGIWNAGDLYERLRRNARLFRNSGGGITLSGGEPLTQPAFVAALLELCDRTALPVGVETCGLFEWSEISPFVERFEFVFFDIKGTDHEAHAHATGHDARAIVANLERLAARLADRITVSVPVIPGVTDTDQEIVAIARLLQDLSISRLRLLGYHDFGRAKYRELGRTYPMPAVDLPPRPLLEALRDVARRAGIAEVT